MNRNILLYMWIALFTINEVQIFSLLVKTDVHYQKLMLILLNDILRVIVVFMLWSLAFDAKDIRKKLKDKNNFKKSC